MPVITVFVATSSQAEMARGWRSWKHFPGQGQQCYALKGSHLSAEQARGAIAELGYRARWIDKLDAVVVEVPFDPLETAAQLIMNQLGFDVRSSGWVVKGNLHNFGE